jgi:hypothetical protein
VTSFLNCGAGAGGDRLASGLAATAYSEECQRDDCRGRQEKAVIQSPVGAEERVKHDASEDEDKREHQPDTDVVPATLTEHALTIGPVRDARRSKGDDTRNAFHGKARPRDGRIRGRIRSRD